MAALRRVNYTFGQVLSVDDFQAEQTYHRDKLRRHNRLLHGSGIGGGLTVSLGGGSSRPAVVVKPGFGIDPAGNELELEAAVSVAITLTARALVVMLRDTEQLVDPVPVPGIAGDADGMAHSRIEERAEVTVLPDDPPNVAAEIGLVLARFVRARAGWQRDRKFRVRRLR